VGGWVGQILQRMVTRLAILLLFTAWTAFGTVNAPTEFRTDPADFSNLALPVGAVQYQFRWTDNSDNEVRYEMEVSSDGVSFVYEGYRLPNATGYDTANVPWTSNRWYRLRAVSASEASTYAGPIKCYGYMPPTNLGGSTAATNRMTITWATAGGMIDGYTVQQATNTTFDGDLVQYFVTNIASTSYTITGACWFGITSVNTNNSETIRLELTGSNYLAWTNLVLSNSASLGPSNNIAVLLLDRAAGTNLWRGYRRGMEAGSVRSNLFVWLNARYGLTS
jgi:hypothetical protein